MTAVQMTTTKCSCLSMVTTTCLSLHLFPAITDHKHDKLAVFNVNLYKIVRYFLRSPTYLKTNFWGTSLCCNFRCEIYTLFSTVPSFVVHYYIYILWPFSGLLFYGYLQFESIHSLYLNWLHSYRMSLKSYIYDITYYLFKPGEFIHNVSGIKCICDKLMIYQTNYHAREVSLFLMIILQVVSKV